MSVMTTNTDHLIRSNIWTTQLKEVFEAELMGMRYVKMLSDFPDGDTFNIPSIGQQEVYDYVEGQPARYTAMDTGNFTFTITDYKMSATSVTEKMKQDSYVMDQVVASFVPKQSRALMEAMESKILSTGPDGQTASNVNAINGANHRFVASGTSEVFAIKDFALAKYALQKADVPMRNLIAIVDPSVEYTLKTLTNLMSLDQNPKWEGIVRDDIATGMKFYFNVLGWDVYVSNFLKRDMAETIGAKSVTVGVANLFFSADSEALPLVGAIRQAPKVDSEYNKDFQREEYVTTARYGFKLYRPEALVTILSDTDQVS